MSIKNSKYIVEIDKDAKRLKRIFEDLKVHRECIIDSNDRGWHSPMRKLGIIISKENLIDDGLIDPIWSVKKHNVIDKRLIRLKPNTEIERIDGNKKTFYKFRRRRLV